MDPIHILNKSGILKSFSVAKRVTQKEIVSFYKKNKKLGKTDDEINDLLQKKIYSDIEEAIKTQKIPGVISPKFVVEKNKKIPLDLDRLIMVVAQKLKEKKYDKMSLCYFVNSLVNILGLGENDFNEFHKDVSSEDDESEDDDNESEDNESEDDED